MSETNDRRLRSIVRAANRQKRLRVELRKLDDKALLTRYARYRGRSINEIKSETRWDWSRGQARDDIIDRITGIEEPMP